MYWRGFGDECACFGWWDVLARRKPRHLPLKQPLRAFGVGDRMRPVAGSTSPRARAAFRRVPLAATRAACGTGSARTFSVTVTLALLAAERQRCVKSCRVAYVLQGHVCWL